MAKLGWLVEIEDSWTNDTLAEQIITNAIAQLEQVKGFSYKNNTIRCNGKLYVGSKVANY